MRKNLVITFCIILLLIGILISSFKIRQVKASGTIYIRADGNIEPPTANITTVNNVTYTFTDNNYDVIVVERDNIILDGQAYTLQGAGTGYGITLFNRSSITIRNLEISAFDIGVWLFDSYNNTIAENWVSNNNIGIWLDTTTDYNTISGNQITDTNTGVIVSSTSNYNTISGNNISNNEFSISFSFSSNNTVTENNITNNDVGVWLVNSSINTISENYLANNGSGVFLDSFSNYNTVSGNSFITDGLLIRSSFGNLVVGNLVNDKPLVYLENSSDLVVKDAGQVILVNCNRVRVENLTLSQTGVGIQLFKTNNTVISRNNITNNQIGVFLTNSSYNTISGNNMTANTSGFWFHSASNNTISGNIISDHIHDGILIFSSSDNTIYHNNFVNNTQQTYIMIGSTNIWNNVCEGNYWSSHVGSDSDGDGIGDTSYIIDGSNQDIYPLMSPYWTPADVNHDLQVDIYDAVTVCVAYLSTPSDLNWNCHSDIAEPIGIIDMSEIEIIQLSYGEVY